MGWISDLFGGAFSFLTGDAIQKGRDERSFQYQKQLMNHSMDLQRGYNAEMMQAAAPAQIAAMRNAGLNPAGANSSVGAMPGATPTGGSGSGASYNGNPIAQAIDVADLLMKKAQKENLEAETKKTYAEAEKIGEEAIGQSYSNDTFYENFRTNIEKLVSEMANKKRDTAFYDYREQETKASIDTLVKNLEVMQSTVDELKSKARLNNMQADRYNEVIDSEINQAMASAASSRATAGYMRMLTNEDKERIRGVVKNLVKEGENIEAQTSFTELNKELTEKYGDAKAISDIFNSVVSGVTSVIGGMLGKFLRGD